MSGEGTRGGKVIGHTKSGKPIYDTGADGHASYGSFTKQDHKDAWDTHHAKMSHADDQSKREARRGGVTMTTRFNPADPAHQKTREHAVTRGKHLKARNYHSKMMKKSGDEKMDFLKGLGITVGEPSLIREEKENEVVRTSVQKGGFDQGRQGADTSFRERLEKSLTVGTEIHIGGFKKGWGDEGLKDMHAGSKQGEHSNELADESITEIDRKHAMDYQEKKNHLRAEPESLITQEPADGDEELEGMESPAMHGGPSIIIISKAKLTDDELLLKALGGIGKSHGHPLLSSKPSKRAKRQPKDPAQARQEMAYKKYLTKAKKKEDDSLFEVVKEKTPKKVIRDVHENSDFGSLRPRDKRKSELDEVLDLIKGGKGSGPRPNQNPHIPLGKKPEGTAKKSFITSAGEGGIVFDFGRLTGNPVADRATELLQRHADPVQASNAAYQQNAYDQALQSYVKKGDAEYSKHTTPFGNVEEGWRDQLNKPLDQQVAEAFKKGELSEEGGPAVKNQFNKTEISLGGQTIKATSPTDAALIELMKGEMAQQQSDGGFIADATGGVTASAVGIIADAVSKQ